MDKCVLRPSPVGDLESADAGGAEDGGQEVRDLRAKENKTAGGTGEAVVARSRTRQRQGKGKALAKAGMRVEDLAKDKVNGKGKALARAVV